MCAISYMYWLPWWLSGKEPACQCRKHRFNPWVRKVPCRWKWQPTPLFLPVKTHGQRSLWSYNPWDHKRIGHNLLTEQQQPKKNISCDTVDDRQISINNGQIKCGIWTSLKIISVNPKGNQPWIFIGRTDVEAESPILRLPDAKSLLIGKDRDAGRNWGQEEKGAAKDESDMKLSKFWETMEDRGTRCAAVHGVAKSHTLLHGWTMANSYIMGNLASIKKLTHCSYRQQYGYISLSEKRYLWLLERGI